MLMSRSSFNRSALRLSLVFVACLCLFSLVLITGTRGANPPSGVVTLANDAARAVTSRAAQRNGDGPGAVPFGNGRKQNIDGRPRKADAIRP